MKMHYCLLLFIFAINGLLAQVSDFADVNFTRADNIAQIHQGASLDNLPLLAYQLTSTLSTDVEKFRAIYKWVCQNIKGDSRQFSKVEKQRKKLKHDSVSFMKWNREYKKIAFKKLLQHKTTMCTGYAYLIKELCFLANIRCQIIDGYARSVATNTKKIEYPNHSWNAVFLGNKWYLCDPTWSSGYLNQDNLFVRDYNDGYFLTAPDLFAKNHYPLQTEWLLDQEKSTSDFVSAPLIYDETIEKGIQPVYPQLMDITVQKNEEVNFSLSSTNKVSEKDVQLVYYSGYKERILGIYDRQQKDNIISFKHAFKAKGTYDTHIKIDGEIIATYTIVVTKD